MKAQRWTTSRFNGGNDMENSPEAEVQSTVREKFPTGRLLIVLLIVFLPVLILLGGVGILLAFRPTSATLPARIGRDCGTISDNTTGPRYDGPVVALVPTIGAEQCLFQAYQKCQTATLAYAVNVIDAGTTDTITIRAHGHTCSLQDTLYRFSTFGDTTLAGPYSCSLLAPQGKGMVVRHCGERGDVSLLPLDTFLPLVGEYCGEEQRAVAAGKACFWGAYAQCHAATLELYATAIRYFTVQPDGSTCTLTARIQVGPLYAPTAPYQAYPCQRLELSQSGLLAKECGSQGDILIPGPNTTPTPSLQMSV
jgi:type III secretory pathway component EscS